ncbi:hypothetical protein MKW98_028665, partial [Papaver atlanticum]
LIRSKQGERLLQLILFSISIGLDSGKEGNNKPRCIRIDLKATLWENGENQWSGRGSRHNWIGHDHCVQGVGQLGYIGGCWSIGIYWRSMNSEKCTIGLATTTASRVLVNWDILEVNEFRKVCSERKGIRSYRCHDLCLA